MVRFTNSSSRNDASVAGLGGRPSRRGGHAPQLAGPAPAAAPGSRTRRRADARRLEILRAAARSFRDHGFAAAGMREIAAEADLSPGNLYHYFRGKDEILYFCQDRSLELMMDALEGARLSGRPAVEQLRSVIEAHVRCLLDELEGSAAHLEVDALPPRLRERIVAKRDRYERGIRRLVASGVRRGELAPCDAKLVTRAILGAMNWTARWFRPEGPRSARSVAEGLADFLVRGVAAGVRPAAAAAPRGRRTSAAGRKSAAGTLHRPGRRAGRPGLP